MIVNFIRLLLFFLASSPPTHGAGICQWIRGHLQCGSQGGTSPIRETDFVLPGRDTDEYFPKNLPLFTILCDKFSNWHGYSLTEVQKLAQKLTITEQSDWSKWNADDTWVFLGYRGTSQQYAQLAAVDGYKINPNGRKEYGDGIYMSPKPYEAQVYALSESNQPHGRLCYNFAPKRILSQLLVCGLCNEWTCGKSSTNSPQRIHSPPIEVSARFDSISSGSRGVAFAVTYPQPFLRHIRMVCIEAKWSGRIPELFKNNNLYYSRWKKQLMIQVK